MLEYQNLYERRLDPLPRKVWRLEHTLKYKKNHTLAFNINFVGSGPASMSVSFLLSVDTLSMPLYLQALPLPSLHWNEATHNAPISAKPDHIRYPTVPDAFNKVKDMSKHQFLGDNDRVCAPGSKRNPGRSGALIDHVIELGSMYHMFEPMDFSTWSLEEAAVEAELLSKDGKAIPSSVI